MPYGTPVVSTDVLTYSTGGILADGEYNSSTVSCQVNFAGPPVSELTEPQKDAIFQDFLDYLAAYPGFVSVQASKPLQGSQDVTPTEEPE